MNTPAPKLCTIAGIMLVLSHFILWSAQASPLDGSGRDVPRPIPGPGQGRASDTVPGQYIVKFVAPPLAVYLAEKGNPPPLSLRAKGWDRVDPAQPESMSYLQQLRGNQGAVLQAMEKTLGRVISVSRSFQVAYNGMAVRMSAAEARRVAQLPGVAAVLPEKVRSLHTDNGPQWIGADDLWTGSVSTATKGEGIVVGVIDTGINPANPSFADIGGDAYNHTNPRGRSYGFCDPGHVDYNAAFPCNDKLIGAYDFTRTSPTPAVLYDNNGHGSHTASTAAGNVVAPAALVGPTITVNRNISGVAPHSNIISYKACIPGGGECMTSWLIAAIEQATLDGVDVINYSIGGSAADPWNDADSEAFLNARQAGVFVAASAGNNGPGSATLGSPGNSPWLLTVGNSSHDRRFVNHLTSLTRTGGSALGDITGASLTASLPATSIVYAGNYGNPLCPLGAFAPGTFSGQIVVCDRGGGIGRVDKGSSVLAGGAGGMVLANDLANGDSLVGDAHVLPAVHITYNDGVALKSWLTSGTNHQAAISGTTVDVQPANGDIMTASSSRGPNTPVPSISKPDVSAPGLDILAAIGTNNTVSWGLLTGTSMASPHAAGAAALLLSLHPAWTPAEVQSALMSTADTTVLKEDGATAADPFDTGAGRVDVSQAAQAGFVLNETYARYLAANPTAGGDPKTLNIASLGRENIVSATSWTRTLTSASDTSWTATVSNPPGVALSVDPPSFSLPAGGSQVVTISADASGAAFGSWLFGGVTFTPAGADAVPAHFPVTLNRTVSTLPASLVKEDVRRYSSTTLSNIEALEITGLTVTQNGLVAADVNNAVLYQDPTTDDPYDGDWNSDDPAHKDGLWVQYVSVPAGAKRLVAEITDTSSPDLDLYVWRWDGANWIWACSSNNQGSKEYCSVTDPTPGDYYVWVQNFLASDPGGTTPDSVELATAVVPGTSAGNLNISLVGGGTSVPPGQPFDLKIGWTLPKSARHWYGRFGLGTDAANPDNLGLVDLNVHVKAGSLFFPVKGKNGKATVIQLN